MADGGGSCAGGFFSTAVSGAIVALAMFEYLVIVGRLCDDWRRAELHRLLCSEERRRLMVG